MGYIDKKGVGKRLHGCREEKRISAKAISAACNIAVSNIYYIENGTYSLPLSKLESISQFLSCDPIWLLTGATASDKQIKSLQKKIQGLDLESKKKLAALLDFELSKLKS